MSISKNQKSISTKIINLCKKMYEKKLLLVIICGIVLIAFIFLYQTIFYQINRTNQNIESAQKGGNTMEIAIYPEGTYSESYYFTIDEEYILSCYLGSRKTDEMGFNVFFERIDEKKQIQMNEEDIKYLIDCADELQNIEYLYNGPYDDGWNFRLQYNETVYYMNYGDSEPKPFQDIIDVIIRLSPIPVDLHGWS